MTDRKRIVQRPVKVPPSREDELFRATRAQAERERPQRQEKNQ